MKGNKRTSILLIVLLGLLVLAYKVMFAPTNEELLVEDDMAIARVEAVLSQVEAINFNTDVLEDPKFKSLKSIETPLVSLPIGKRNPFSSIFGSN